MGLFGRVVWKTVKYGSATAATAVAGITGYVYSKEPKKIQESEYRNLTPNFERRENIKRLKNEEFDVLVIGGGATGTSVALDCASRGLKCALVERYDFASGTSSRSTKLLHGGVRYLEQAVYTLDPGMLMLVWEALRERGHMLHSTPFMTRGLPIVMPLYSIFDTIQMSVGVTAYEILGRMATLFDPGLPNCYLISPSNAVFNFPLLKAKGLRSALLYYDGQQNDARVNMSIAMTAATPNYVDGWEAAAISNHTKAEKILLNDEGKPKGALVRDELSGEEFEIKSKVVMNCGGPFSDEIRKRVDGQDPNMREYIVPAMGAHVTLPRAYSAPHVGFMIPKTSDGRVLFYLPWEGNVVAGTTDLKQPLTDWPSPTAEEVDWIVRESSNYLELAPEDIRKDIKSAWSGIRPLVRNPRADPSDTKSLSRDHEVIIDDNGLVTVCGGKWTTCRLMAEDGVTKMLARHPEVKARLPCRTYHLHLIDSHDMSGRFKMAQAQHCLPDKVAMYISRTYGLELVDAYHLVHNYGFRALQLIEESQHDPDMLSTFFTAQNFLRAEIVFAVKHEMAHTLYDVVMNRLRCAFVDHDETLRVLPEIADLMQSQLGWSSHEKDHNLKQTRELMHQFAYVNPDNPLKTIPTTKRLHRRRTYKATEATE